MINKSTEELVVDKICRSCMSQNENMRDVFEPKDLGGEQSLQIADMLMDCASVAVRSGDGLPSLLCADCEDKLNAAYEFRQQCQKSDSTLRQLTNNPVGGGEIGKGESCDIVVQPDFNIPDLFRDSSGDDDGAAIKRSKALFVCPFCDKELQTKKGLVIHQRRHTGEKMRTCHLCNAQFTRTHHLIRHMKIHSSASGDGLGGQAEARDNDGGGKNDGDDSDVSFEPAGEDGDGDISDFMSEYLKPKTKTRKKRQKKKKKDKGAYQCKCCFKTMTTLMGLKIHMRRHTGTDLAKCKLCEKSFTKASHLKRHLQTHGVKDEEKAKPPEKAVMQCEFCDRAFKYRKSFNHHMQTEHGVSEADESDVPLSAYLPKKPNKAPAATPDDGRAGEANKDDQSDDSSSIREPAKKATNHKVHTCHVCAATFARANHLTRHMTLHRALLTHKCDRCDKAFASDDHLKKHVEDEHINKPYVCTICNKPFSRGEHLIRHLKIHQNGQGAQEGSKEDLTCSICEKTFGRSDHLARHIKIHLLEDKRHVCKECGKAFNRLDNLKTHQRIHSGIKDTTKLHLCIYCGKEFNNSSNMIVHMRRHTGERPYKCGQCGKGFPRSHDLKCHERTHSGEKPYQCSLCGKSFNKSNKLLRHTRVHTGERPYVCNICGRAFTQSNDLALHMRRHTGARPYACGMCPARFIQSGQLKTHRRSTGHWIETQPDLKGGHRVEPVTALVEPVPIRFKKHGGVARSHAEEEEGGGQPREERSQPSSSYPRTVPAANKLTGHAISLFPPLHMQGEPMMIDSKIVELHTSGFVNLVGKFKEDVQEGQSFVIGPAHQGADVKSEGVIVKSDASSLTYSVVTPISVPPATFTATDFSNYQNYG